MRELSGPREPETTKPCVYSSPHTTGPREPQPPGPKEPNSNRYVLHGGRVVQPPNNLVAQSVVGAPGAKHNLDEKRAGNTTRTQHDTNRTVVVAKVSHNNLQW